MKARRRIVGLGVLIAIAASTLAYADGHSQQTSTLDLGVDPSRVGENFRDPVDLTTKTGTFLVADPTARPPFQPTKITLDYDDDFVINVKSVTNCTATLTALNTTQARDACPNSVLGYGKEGVIYSPTLVFNDVRVTLFRKNDNIYLHTDDDALGASATPDVTANVSEINQADFGTRIEIPVAPDPYPAQTKLNMTMTHGVTARCHDTNKELDAKSVFDYSDGSSDSPTADIACTRK